MISRRAFVSASLCAAIFVAAGVGNKPSTIQIWTDSTGNGDREPREWPYLWADSLAQSGSGVELAGWDVDHGRYGPQRRFGFGRNPLILRNFAVSGATFEYAMGGLWGTAFAERPDVLIISLGLNHAQGLDRSVVFGEMVAGIERFVSTYPDVPIVFVKQNPFRDTDDMAKIYEIVDRLAPIYDLRIIDVGALFEAKHKDAALYLSDGNTHPNQRGEQLYADAVQTAWPPRMEVNRPSRPQLVNLLSNPHFEIDSQGGVAGWSAGGLGKLTLEKNSGLQVRCAGGYGYLYQDISAENLSAALGQNISVAFDLRLEGDAADGQGRIFVTVSSPRGSQTVQSRASLPPGGIQGWRAICDVPVPPDVLSIRVGVYHDQAPLPSVVPLELSRSMVVAGSFPRLEG
ncbi:MAG TPA: SGNH/GDSL hydrolase family protein [Devosia sp.]|nr:SGNH/GDSL hydrolase family protein [Devosia sp.]